MADYRTQRNPRQVHQQRQFLKGLQAKGFQFKVGRPEQGPAGLGRGLGGGPWSVPEVKGLGWRGRVPRGTESTAPPPPR